MEQLFRSNHVHNGRPITQRNKTNHKHGFQMADQCARLLAAMGHESLIGELEQCNTCACNCERTIHRHKQHDQQREILSVEEIALSESPALSLRSLAAKEIRVHRCSSVVEILCASASLR